MENDDDILMQQQSSIRMSHLRAFATRLFDSLVNDIEFHDFIESFKKTNLNNQNEHILKELYQDLLVSIQQNCINSFNKFCLDNLVEQKLIELEKLLFEQPISKINEKRRPGPMRFPPREIALRLVVSNMETEQENLKKELEKYKLDNKQLEDDIIEKKQIAEKLINKSKLIINPLKEINNNTI